MGTYGTKFCYPLGENLPAGALSQALDNQRKALLDAMLGEMKPNRKYIVEVRQEHYEDPPSYTEGYRGAIYIQEYIDEGEG